MNDDKLTACAVLMIMGFMGVLIMLALIYGELDRIRDIVESLKDAL